MTDDNQNASDPSTEAKPEFGSDKDQSKVKPQFGQDDISEILKQNVHGQAHIKTLESETAQLREEIKTLQQELANAKSVDDLINEIRQNNESTTMTGSTTPQIDEEQLLAKLTEKVTSTMTLQEQLKLETDNWNTVTQALQAKHGEGYAAYVDSRARELGMNNVQMETLARQNPKAFIELVSPGTTFNRTAPTTPSMTSPKSNESQEQEAEFSKVARLKKDLSTEEGREANRKWNDPDWQRVQRQRILDKAKREGKL